MEYVLHRKSNCKKIKIRVVKGVVCVSAPLNVSKREIDDFVKEQSAWIKNQLSKYTLSKENDLISLLGKKYRLHYIGQRVCYVKGDDLYLYPDQTLIQKFLKQNTKKYIDLRFEFFCEQLHIQDISLQYGFYKSKWGSCTPSKRKICFNVNLIFMPLEFVDTIILHELAHLFHFNHSKDFYNLLCTWMPNYRQVLKENKRNPIPNLY